jgi:hypothetical protein
MRWLVRRVLMLWLITFALCGVVALLVRLNREPGPLQALGFDVCDGEPCFRGIKPGLDWVDIPKRFPMVTYLQESRNFALPLDIQGSPNVYFQSSTDETKLAAIAITDTRILTYPLTPGELVILYGPPCRVDFYEAGVGFIGFNIRFPGILARYEISANAPSDDRIDLDAHAVEFWIVDVEFVQCKGPVDIKAYERWHGFTSANVYRARNRRALRAK